MVRHGSTEAAYRATAVTKHATVENTDDQDRRDRLIDCILTIPPLTEWPADWPGPAAGRLQVHFQLRP
jgi:hypothetical protein